MIERALLAGVIFLAILAIGRLLQRRSARQRAAVVGAVRADLGSALVPQILAFSGPGCPSCNVQKEILAALEEESRGAFTVRHHDAAQEYDLASRFAVRVVPTTVVTAADGRVIEINSGLADAERLRLQLQQAA
jgi:thioredoxin-like negative regulator of GroEL